MINEALGVVHRYIHSAASNSKRNPRDSVIKRIGLVRTRGGGSSGRAQFEPPDFDLEEITAAYDTDAYVRGAIDKYTDLIFKAGWEVTSNNDNAADYIRLRFDLMAEATQTPTEEFLNQIAEDLVKYGNVFIAKARTSNDYSFPNGVQVNQVGDKKPIAGYFVLPPETIQVARDKNGTVKGYQQSVGDKPVAFMPEDMIHITWKKRRGQAYGSPFLIPVLPDVRLLREVEDNVSRLLHKYLHPLYKFKVGLEKDGFQSTPEEVELVREMIETMPTDGTLVLPERYDVEVVGAQGEAINSEWALRYFEQRVFTGLGVPETVFGRGSTTNRSTADNLTSEMHDRVKAFQRVIASSVVHHIVNELLLEGGFDPIMDVDDQVLFQFLEIAIDEQIKLENQAAFLYEHNVITFAEMRQRIGYEQVPDDESLMYLNRVQIPLRLLGGSEDDEPGTDETNNKMKPTNQHGTKTSPKKTSSVEKVNISESFSSKEFFRRFEMLIKKLNERYEVLKNDLVAASKASKDNPSISKQSPLVINKTKEYLLTEFKKYSQLYLREGIDDVKKVRLVTRSLPVNESLALRRVNEEFEMHISRLFSNLQEAIIDSEGLLHPPEKVSSSFDLFKHRVSSISRSSLMKCYNYGYSLSAKELGETEVYSSGDDIGCNTCLERSETKILLNGDFYHSIPPWHTNCICHIKISDKGRNEP